SARASRAAPSKCAPSCRRSSAGAVLGPILDQTFRREGGRVLAQLIRRLGDFELAETALQDAFARALQAWAKEGIPDRPGAWLLSVAHRRGLDLLRKQNAAPFTDGEVPEVAAPPMGPDDEVRDSGVADDQLRLIFTCCQPALAQPAQAALALRTLGGLSTREIARAFLETEATTAQRLVRAKRKIAEARIPYEVPSRE